MELVLPIVVIAAGAVALIWGGVYFDVWRARKSREQLGLSWQGIAASVDGQLQVEQKRHMLFHLPEYRLIGSIEGAKFTMSAEVVGRGEDKRNETKLQARRAGSVTELLQSGAEMGNVRVTRARSVGRLIRRAGAQDIATGDAEFDRGFILVGRREEAARRLFASARLRAAVRDAMADGLGFLDISESMVLYSEDGELKDRTRLRALIDLFEVTLKRLDQLSPRSDREAASGEAPTLPLIDF